jgi:hypothetical protein
VTMAVPFSSDTGDPGEERLAEAARLLVARHGDPVRIEEADGDLSDSDRRLEADGGLLPTDRGASPQPEPQPDTQRTHKTRYGVFGWTWRETTAAAG